MYTLLMLIDYELGEHMCMCITAVSTDGMPKLAEKVAD